MASAASTRTDPAATTAWAWWTAAARRASARRSEGMVTTESRAMGGQRGFTVIEVLITLAVTLIGLAGLMTLHHVISSGAGTAGRMAEASAIADAALEEVRQLHFTQIQTRFGAPPVDVELEDAEGTGTRVYHRRLLIDPLTSVS